MFTNGGGNYGDSTSKANWIFAGYIEVKPNLGIQSGKDEVLDRRSGTSNGIQVSLGEAYRAGPYLSSPTQARSLCFPACAHSRGFALVAEPGQTLCLARSHLTDYNTSWQVE